MWGDSEPGVGRIDPVAYFGSRRGLRTVGYEKHRSQVVFGNDTPEEGDSENAHFTHRRARGPGKEFGRFVEMFGFPEKRPQSSSQKRLFTASMQSDSINIFQRPCEFVSRGSVVKNKDRQQSQFEPLPVNLPIEVQREGEVEDVTYRGEGDSELFEKDGELLAEKKARIHLLEQALERERREMQTLQNGGQLQVPKVAVSIDGASIQQEKEEQYNGGSIRRMAESTLVIQKDTDDDDNMMSKLSKSVMKCGGGVLASGGAKGRCIDKAMSSFFDAELSSSQMQRHHNLHEKRGRDSDRCAKQQKPLTPAFDAYVVLDFEATCERRCRIPEPEIIEFPMIIVDSRSGSILAEFQRYVRPVINPKLSAFCSQLTGITQATVEKAQSFPLVFEEAIEFLRRGEYGEAPPMRSFLFVTCGDWDLRTMLPSQLQTTAKVIGTSLDAPPMFRRWCNIKQFMQSIAAPLGDGRHPRIRDLPDMMAALNLSMTGRHHSGIDDCRNIVAILQRLMQDGHVILPTADHSGLHHWVSVSQNSVPLTSSLVPPEDCPPPSVFDEERVAVFRDGQKHRTPEPNWSQGYTHQMLVKKDKQRATKRPLINVLEGDDPLSELLQMNNNNNGTSALSETKKVAYSKALSRILRHAAESMGIPISSAGYVRVDEILHRKPFCDDGNMALAYVALVVHSNEKQRFKMVRDDKGHLYIRANQGHSIDGIHPGLRRITRIEEARVAIHGTYHRAWEQIRECGYLSTMKRQHIHFAKGLSRNDGVISGMRGNVEVLLYLDVGKVLADGVELLESSNGVLLSPGVGCTKQLPLTYISSVVDCRSGNVLFSSDGCVNP